MKLTLFFSISLLLLSPAWGDLVSAKAYPAKDILFLSGSSQEMGKLQGRAYGAELKQLVKDWLDPHIKIVPFLTKALALKKARNMEKFIPQEYIDEMKAIAETSGVPYEDVLVANGIPDISEMVNQPFGCTSVSVLPSRSETGAMFNARNLDFETSDVLRKAWKPLIYARPGTLKILSVHIPGFVGVMTGINEKGVMMAVHTSYHLDSSSRGIPLAIAFRMVLEKATTAEEAKDAYLALKRTVPINVMISDSATALVLEVTSKKHAVRRAENGVVYTANHFASKEMKNFMGKEDERWPQLQAFEAKKGKFTDSELNKIMAQTGWESGNILTVLADYSKKLLYFGSDPEGAKIAADGQLYSVNWNDLFRSTR